MSPLVVIAVAFLNVLIGVFSRRQTVGVWFSLVAIVVAYFAYEYALNNGWRWGWCSVGGMPCGSPEQMALVWGMMGSLPLWFVVWLGKVMHSLT
jgi:hypothetical protein